MKTRIAGKEAARVAEDMAKPGPIRVVAAGEAQEAPGRSRAIAWARAGLPEAVHEALREAAFHERCKIHDIIMQGIDAALRKRGYPSVEALKAR